MSELPDNLMNGFMLTKEQRESQLWVSIVAHLNERLGELRKRNDSAKLSEAETARLRGHIQCLKSLIDLGKEPSPRQAPQRPSVTTRRQMPG